MINEAIKVINFLRKRPMLFLAIAISFMVFLVYYSFFSAILFAALCIIVMFVINYKKQSGVLILCVVWLLLAALSSAHCLGDIDRISYLDTKTVSGEFVVTSAAENRGDFFSCEVEVLKCEHLKNGDKLAVSYQGPKIEVGQSFKAKGEIKEMSKYKSAKSYYSKNIYAFANLSEIVLTDNSSFSLTLIQNVRKYIKNKIFKYLDRDEAATMLALLTGDRTYLSDEFYSNLKDAGVMHVMVVSGMHLSVIVSFALYIVNKFLYNRYLKALIIFLTVIVVSSVCGFTMSIMRAGITYSLIALALLIGRQSKSENTLGAAVSIILLFNPLAIFSVAFELSVLSTFGILCVAIPIIEFVNTRKIINSKVLLSGFSSALITLSATLLTLPVTISVFGYVSNVSLVTNLLIGFAATIALCFCISGFVLFPFRSVIFYFTNFVLKYINTIINYFGSLDFSVTNLPEWTAYLSAAVIFSVLFLLVACTNRENVLKLELIVNKKIKEGGGKLKWPSFLKKR